MTKPPLDLGPLGATDAQATALHPLDELMVRALEAPSGLELTFADEASAHRKRHQLYKRRDHHRSLGFNLYDSLLIRKEGSTLFLVKETPFEIKEI